MRDLELPRARDRVLAGSATRNVRAPIRASWLRARRLGLRADAYLPPVPLAEDDVRRARETHPLAAVWPTLLDSLRWVTTEPGCLLFLSDANGHLLWVRGGAATMNAAEGVHLVPGARWSEDAAGTSGVGTALALRRPFQVFGAEHFLSAATNYTCTAAPIRDPETGDVLGAIDLTCATREPVPHLMNLLATTARLAESQLMTLRLREFARLREKYADRLAHRGGMRAALVDASGTVLSSNPDGWLPRELAPLREGEHVLADGRAVTVERLAPAGPFLVVAQRDPGAGLSFQALGRARAILRVGEVTHELSRRHSEIIAILLANPGGLNARELAHQVYGPGGKTVTLRAELTRLRPVLGYRLASDPYRLAGECDADFVALESNVPSGPVAGLLDAYPGPLLPGSVAPGVCAIRDRLYRRLHARVPAHGDADAQGRWSSHH